MSYSTHNSSFWRIVFQVIDYTTITTFICHNGSLPRSDSACRCSQSNHTDVNTERKHTQTRLSSSKLRPTAHERVPLVMRAHFGSRDKHGGHTIRSALVENPMLHINFVTMCFLVSTADRQTAGKDCLID